MDIAQQNQPQEKPAQSTWSALLNPFRDIFVKRDYGQVLIAMAVGVGLPRWAGAMLAADGIRIFEGATGPFVVVYWLLVFLYGLSSMGMAMLEVLAIGYVFDALRKLQPTKLNGQMNIRWWGSLIFGIMLLIMMPVILAPNMLAQLNGKDIVSYLADNKYQIAWVVTVILAPMVIIGGVSFARDGMVGTSTANQPQTIKTKSGKPQTAVDAKLEAQRAARRARRQARKAKQQGQQP